jgi:hypothetical protein
MMSFIIDHIGVCAFELMHCARGHRWNRWNRVYNEGTAIQYRDNVCPYCSNDRQIVYGRPFQEDLEESNKEDK